MLRSHSPWLCDAASRRNFRHLPVVDEDTKQCVGIVTVADLLSVLVPAKAKGPRVSRIHEYMNMLVARRRKPSEKAAQSVPKDAATATPATPAAGAATVAATSAPAAQ